MDSTISPEQQRKSRRSFIFVCLAFIIPIVLAKFALDQQWFNYGVTNQGKLLEKPIHISELGVTGLYESVESDQKPWLLVYHIPSSCGQQCVQLFNGLTNTYVALGKGMMRVDLLALSAKPATITENEAIDVNRWSIQTVNSMNVPSALTQVFIVDPLGNIVLMHELPSSTEQIPAFGKSIIADFKVLLKLSRIG